MIETAAEDINKIHGILQFKRSKADLSLTAQITKPLGLELLRKAPTKSTGFYILHLVKIPKQLLKTNFKVQVFCRVAARKIVQSHNILKNSLSQKQVCFNYAVFNCYKFFSSFKFAVTVCGMKSLRISERFAIMVHSRLLIVTRLNIALSAQCFMTACCAFVLICNFQSSLVYNNSYNLLHT